MSNHPGLGDLALVCRAWYQLIAPELYSKLEVVISAEFGLCSLQNKTAQHARRVLLRGTGLFAASATLRRSFPKAVWLFWCGPKVFDRVPDYHPSHARIYTQIHSA